MIKPAGTRGGGTRHPDRAGPKPWRPPPGMEKIPADLRQAAARPEIPELP
jgi:hypothetical protein